MDTISRENSPSYLPIVSLIAAIVAAGLALGAMVKAGHTETNLETAQKDLGDRVSAVETTATVASAAAKAAASRAELNDIASKLAGNQNTLNDNFEVLKKEIADMKKPSAANKGPTSKETAVAGKDEYIVKSGDTGSSIAKANGVSLTALMAVNPSIDWKKMHVGDKIKLPEKK